MGKFSGGTVSAQDSRFAILSINDQYISCSITIKGADSGFKWSFNTCTRSTQEPSGPISQKFQAKSNSENRCLNTANRFASAGSILMLYPCGYIHPVNGCFKFKESKEQKITSCTFVRKTYLNSIT